MIESKEGNVRYYGSTVQDLKKRLIVHRSVIKKRYITSKEVLKYDDCKIILVELYPCNSKKELETRERYYIENNECVNKQIPTRTHKEWRVEHKEEIAQKQKERYEENKDEILQKNKERYEENKDEILQKNKEWRKENKEEIAQRRKEYYEENKDEILQKQKEKITCPCGSDVIKSGIRRHERSKKHQEWEQLYNFIYS